MMKQTKDFVVKHAPSKREAIVIASGLGGPIGVAVALYATKPRPATNPEQNPNPPFEGEPQPA